MPDTVFSAAEMKALKHLLFHFRSYPTRPFDEVEEMRFAGLDDEQIEKLVKKLESAHAGS